MKNIALFIVALCAFSCSSEKNNNANNQIVTDFLENTSTLEAIDNKNPIVIFKEAARENAEESLTITKDNVDEFLEKTKNFKHCVITVEDHTIVKIIDTNDCKQSGSWGGCMPLAEGYIKKGELTAQEDYINNIIGVPDAQTRTAFFFN